VKPSFRQLLGALTKVSRHVLVTGQPGAGKTTHARKLQEETGLPIVHIDDELTQHPAYKEQQKILKRVQEAKDRITREALVKEQRRILKRVREAEDQIMHEALAREDPHIIEGWQLPFVDQDKLNPHRRIVIGTGKKRALEQYVTRGLAADQEGTEQTIRSEGASITATGREALERFRKLPGTEIRVPRVKKAAAKDPVEDLVASMSTEDRQNLGVTKKKVERWKQEAKLLRDGKGDVVGFHAEGSKPEQLGSIFVDPKNRRQGHAIRQLRKWLAAQKGETAASALDSNTPSMEMLKRLGFEETGRLRGGTVKLKKTAAKDPARWNDPVVYAPHARLTKKDLFEYYDNQDIKKRILDAVGKTETLIRQSFAPQLMILRRKDGQGRLIHLGKEYNRWNDMRMSEVHPTFGAKVNFILADIDPQSKVPWRKTKNITETVAKTMSSHPDIKNVEIQFSGGRGFYVKGFTRKEMDIDRARKMTQDILGGVAARPDVTFGVAAPDQIRLDTTPLKRRGSVRAPYSLNTATGLVSAPVKIEDLPHVQKEDFVIKKILATIVRLASKRASAEFAPGIPKSRKVETLPHFRRPRDWTMVVQVHDAKRAGKHWDLRLVDPKTDMAHSFAVPKSRFPGKKDRMLLAIQQPTHTADYALNFEGDIPAGTYGAGKVTQELKEKVRILKSSDNKLQFERPDGDKYTLFRTRDSNWGIVRNN
jgi:RimJ/RimL family protein N-acetyltransferase